MKITIYELVGLVINGKAPRQIKYSNRIYDYNEKQEDYECFIVNYYDYLLDNTNTFQQFNNEVEIIEEEFEDIEQETEIQLLKVYQEYLENNFTVTMTNIISDIEAIFNETNDKINQLIKNQKLIIEKIGENK